MGHALSTRMQREQEQQLAADVRATPSRRQQDRQHLQIASAVLDTREQTEELAVHAEQGASRL